MKAKGLAWKSTYFLKVTHYGRDLVVQRFAKPWPKVRHHLNNQPITF